MNEEKQEPEAKASKPDYLTPASERFNLKERELTEEEMASPTASEYMGISEVFTYWFRKKDPNRPSNFNIRAMHTINKISLAMFLIAFVVWLLRRLL